MRIYQIFILFFIFTYSLSQQIRDDVYIWPYPRIYKDTIPGTTLYLSTLNFKFTLFDGNDVQHNPSAFPIIVRAIERYKRKIFYDWNWDEAPDLHPKDVTGDPLVNEIKLKVDEFKSTLDLNTDESYTLFILKDKPIQIIAKNTFGILRGLESLSQLIQWTGRHGVYQIKNAPIMVEDYPRFKWRGLLLDTARRFHKVETIFSILDSMEHAKLNVLHLHLTDAESFPVRIKNYPDLSKKGKFATKLEYTEKDLQKIYEYATDRGIRIVPEFDIPGHAYSWGLGYPEITAKCPKYMHNINNIPLNPISEFTYEVIDGILYEMSLVFKDDYIHFGADQVIHGCWKNDTSINDYITKNGITAQELQAIFQKRLEQIYRKYNKFAIFWNEILTELKSTTFKLPSDSIVQLWNQPEFIKTIVKQGYKTLISHGWYLDKDGTWKDMYMNEPFLFSNLTEVEQNLVIGGEGCMWSTRVDASNLDSTIWPRAAAIAERLWSPIWVNDPNKAEPRLEHFRCHTLLKRGVRAGPVRPGYCPYTYAPIQQYNETYAYLAFILVIVVLVIILLIVTIVAVTYIVKYNQTIAAYRRDVFGDGKILLSGQK